MSRKLKNKKQCKITAFRRNLSLGNRFTVIPYRKGLGIEFYRTREWLQLRYLVIKQRGSMCEVCRNENHDGAQVDHIFPRSRYPDLELSIDNLRVLCAQCNYGKGSFTDKALSVMYKKAMLARIDELKERIV